MALTHSIPNPGQPTAHSVNRKRAEELARKSSFAGLALILLAAAIATVPVALHRPLFADDLEFHLISWIDAQQSWLHGVAYPHWASTPNFGAGEPRFIFYPPLSWMLGATLGLVFPWAMVPAVLTFLLLAATGLATRALAREFLPDGPATMAGCAALFSGYALFTAYERAAYGELAAGCSIPLLLLFVLRDRNPSAALWRRALDGSTLPLALAVAAAWLSDAPAGVMASYLLAAVALTSAVFARSWFPIVRASMAFTLGIGLCAFYLVPAAWEQRWVDIQQAIGVNGDPGMRIENNWLFPHHSNIDLKQRDADLRVVSLVAVSMIGVALLSFAVLRLRARLSMRQTAAGRHGKDSRIRQGQLADGEPLLNRRWIPMALIPAAVLVLMLPVSLPLWNLLPKLRFLQFPWRWLLVVEAPRSVFFAAAVWPSAAASLRQRRVVSAVCALLFLAATIFAAAEFFRVGSDEEQLPGVLSAIQSGVGFVGSDEYAPPGADDSTVPTGLPDACLEEDFDSELGVVPTPDTNPAWLADQGACIATATATLRQPEHLRISMTAPRAGFVILKLRSYPAWRVTVDGQLADPMPASVPAPLPAREDGLIVVRVPQGRVELAADWTSTNDALFGRSLSGVAVLLLLAIGLLERRQATPRQI